MPKKRIWHSTRYFNSQMPHREYQKAPLIRLGFVPLADCAAIAVARETGIFERHGLDVELSRELGWASVRDKMFYESLEAAEAIAGIARAFALQPKMLLLDEPFGMLDSLTKMELQEVLLALWRRNKLTTLMVTHDVDEAIFLSDRVVMMTDGPAAEVGDILTIPFERPRNRVAILADPRYAECRNHLLTFLNERSHLRPSLGK